MLKYESSACANESLEGLYSSSLIWIENNLGKFSVKPYHGSSRLLDLIKPLGELVLTSSIIRGLRPAEDRERFEAILAFAWDEMNRGELLLDILTSRPDLLVLVSIYSTFWREGFRSLAFEAEVGKIIRTPGYIELDLPAWRLLDLIYSLEIIGMTAGKDISETFARTWLSGCHSPWTLTAATAYGLTHTAFYMSDYGSKREGIPERVRDYLNQNIPGWIENYLSEDNMDLAAEMIMTQYCSGRSPISPSTIFALKDAQLKDGSVPGPPFGAMSLLFGEEDGSRRVFLQNYHTTIVVCVAAAMQLAL